MAQPKIYEGSFFEGRKFWIMDRPVGPDGSVSINSDVTGYTLDIYDSTQQGNPTLVHTETTTGTLNLTEKAELTTDGYWTLDDTGYTMRLEVDPEAWNGEDAVGGRSYLLRLLYTSAAWDAIPLFWLLKCERDPAETL